MPLSFNELSPASPSSIRMNRPTKACAFLNLWVTQKDGRRTKLGAIALKSSSRSDLAVLEFLRADESNIDKLKAALELVFVDVVSLPEKTTFSL